MNNSLIDQIDVWGFEEGITVFKDKSLGFGFKIEPKDIGCDTDESVNQVRHQLKAFLGSLPSNIDVQFVQSVEKGSRADLEEHLSLAEGSMPLLKQMTEQRFLKFKELEDSGQLPTQENLVFVRMPFNDELSLKM